MDKPSLKKSPILLVDDDEVFRQRLAISLESLGQKTLQAANYEQAINVVRKLQPNRAIIDLKMPGESGLQLVRYFKETYPELRMVVLTGYGSIATALEAVKLGAINFLSKPADSEEILRAFDGQKIPTQNIPVHAPSLARAEWEHIQRVLSDCDGNISEAARRLGIHRRSLQRKLQKNPPKL